MKKLITVLLFTAIMSGCNFSKGIKTEFSTGLTYSYNGFRIDDVKVLNSSLNPIKGKKHAEGTVLRIELHGIKGYAVENGKIYPGCSVGVTDNEQNIILKNEDIFKDYETTADHFAVPYINLSFGNSFLAGKEYELNAHFYDKKKPENIIDIKLKFEIVAK